VPAAPCGNDLCNQTVVVLRGFDRQIGRGGLAKTQMAGGIAVYPKPQIRWDAARHDVAGVLRQRRQASGPKCVRDRRSGESHSEERYDAQRQEESSQGDPSEDERSAGRRAQRGTGTP
jgi:hypothetical protein